MGALGFTNSEDPFVTGIVMTIMSVAFLAYVCLCCHVCGLQFHIRQLLRSISAHHIREERPFGSAPVFTRYLTPPPRYSDITNSLPSYSCALRRMLQLVNGPVHLRFVVHVDKNDGGGSVLAGQPHTTEDNSQAFSRDHNRLSYELGSYRLMPVLGHSPTSEAGSGRKVSTSSDENSPKETLVIEGGTAHSAIKITVESAESSPLDHATDISDVLTPISFRENGTLPRPDLELVTHGQANGSPLPMDLNQTPVSLNLAVNNHERSNLNGDGCQSSNNSINTIEGSVQGPNLRRETISDPEYPSSLENGLTENSIKLLMSGIRGMEQVVVAMESSPNCYVAHWPVPSKDHIDTEGLEVSVEGHPVDKIYVEFLNAGGQSICMAQLLPSHNSSSPNNQMRYHYRVPVSPPQGLPSLLRATSTATSTPSPSENISSLPSVTPTLTHSSVTPSSETQSSLTSQGLTSSSFTHVTGTSSLMTSSLLPMSSSSGTPSGASSLMSSSLAPSSAESLSTTPLHLTSVSGASLDHT